VPEDRVRALALQGLAEMELVADPHVVLIAQEGGVGGRARRESSRLIVADDLPATGGFGAELLGDVVEPREADGCGARHESGLSAHHGRGAQGLNGFAETALITERGVVAGGEELRAGLLKGFEGFHFVFFGFGVFS
jgi:hypothetical protein